MESLVFILETLCSVDVGVFIPIREMPPRGDKTLISLIWKLRLPLGCFSLLMPLNQEEKEVIVLNGVTEPNFQGEIG